MEHAEGTDLLARIYRHHYQSLGVLWRISNSNGRNGWHVSLRVLLTGRDIDDGLVTQANAMTDASPVGSQIQGGNVLAKYLHALFTFWLWARM